MPSIPTQVSVGESWGKYGSESWACVRDIDQFFEHLCPFALLLLDLRNVETEKIRYSLDIMLFSVIKHIYNYSLGTV